MRLSETIRNMGLRGAAALALVGCGANNDGPVSSSPIDDIVAASVEKHEVSLGKPTQVAQRLGLHEAPIRERHLPGGSPFSNRVPLPLQDEDAKPLFLKRDEHGKPIKYSVAPITESDLQEALKHQGIDSKDFNEKEKLVLRSMAHHYIERNDRLEIDEAYRMAVMYVSVEKDLRQNGSPQALNALERAKEVTNLKELEEIFKIIFDRTDDLKPNSSKLKK